MHRASNTFSVLQATAAIVSFAVILWSFGLPSFHFAEAANVTSYSDTLSTSQPSVAADHTIVFTTPSGVANNNTITIDLSSFNGTSSITATDIAVSTTSAFTVAATCGGGEQIGAAFGTNDSTLTLTLCASEGYSIPANGTTTIAIGGTNKLVNPTAGSYQIPLTAGASDLGETRVAIVDTVTVTASVDTYFQFSVAGVTSGQTVNGTTTGGATSATLIPFGELSAGSASTAAQDLTVVTNARNGFTVTVTSDGQLDSITGADIDGFRNGGYDSSPQPWEAPSVTIGQENTYGHWGITSDDTDIFAATETYVSASTTAVQIFTHDSPVDGVNFPSTGTSTTRVGYTVQVSALQEAATDYEATLTYVATPVF